MRRLRLMAVVAALAASVGCASDRREVKLAHPTILRTQRTEKVFVDVRNASSAQNFPLLDTIKGKLAEKGYALVDKAAQSDVQLRVLVHFCGLEQDAVKGDKIVTSGVIGGAVGGIGAAAGRSSGAGTAIGVLIGAIIGAGSGYLWERQNLRNSFVGLVAFEIDQKGKPTIKNQVAARIRKKDLALDQAVDMIAKDVGTQIAGIF